MRYKILSISVAVAVSITATSCASLFTGSTKKVTMKGIPGTTVVDKDKNKLIAEIGQNGFAEAQLKKQLKNKTIEATKDGYIPKTYVMDTKIQGWFWGNILFGGIPGMGIDALTGKMMTFKDDFIDLTLQPRHDNDVVDVRPPLRVDRSNPGATDMEQTILRWYFDSDPRGARIFYRVISAVPEEVKNTNETYLTTTPLEETRSFNIPGLTYDNAQNVTVEIKVSKRGYADQVKRFNVRQALDQQEISGFFELVEN